MSSFKAPLFSEVLDEKGLFGRVWQQFWRLIEDCLAYVGSEETIELANNVTDQTYLKLDKTKEVYAEIDLVVHRLTADYWGFEKHTLRAMYNPALDSWNNFSQVSVISTLSGGAPTLISFSLLGTGEIVYTTTDYTGLKKISKSSYRKRSIAAKSNLFSKMG